MPLLRYLLELSLNLPRWFWNPMAEGRIYLITFISENDWFLGILILSRHNNIFEYVSRRFFFLKKVGIFTNQSNYDRLATGLYQTPCDVEFTECKFDFSFITLRWNLWGVIDNWIRISDWFQFLGKLLLVWKLFLC